jgi:hypothetical protein
MQVRSRRTTLPNDDGLSDHGPSGPGREHHTINGGAIPATSPTHHGRRTDYYERTSGSSGRGTGELLPRRSTVCSADLEAYVIRSSTWCVCLVLLSVASAVADDQALLKQAIAVRGAAQVLAEVYDKPERWPAIVDGISRGERGWLEIAALLRPASDAGASEDLDQAMAEALRRVPRSVLPLLTAAQFEPEAVCGNYEALHRQGADTSKPALLKWLREQESAVREVQEPQLRKVQDQCLRRIRAARAEVLDPCFGRGPECGRRTKG